MKVNNVSRRTQPGCSNCRSPCCLAEAQRIMVAVGEQVLTPWFLSSGVAGFLVILLLSIFLTALCSCSDCRRSVQLKDQEADKKASALISVVRLEETRENPMMSQIQSAEKDPSVKEQSSVHIIPWRSHLKDPPCSDIFSFSSPAPNDYAYAGRLGFVTNGVSLPPAIDGERDPNDPDRNSVFAAYARASQKKAPPIASVQSPTEVKEGAEPGLIIAEVVYNTNR